MMGVLPWLVSAWLVGIGLYGIVTSRNYVHLIGCLSVVQASTYVLLLAVGYRWDAGAPIFFNHPPGTPAVDPVMQALVLTDIVIGATVTALLLALTLQLHKRRGTLDPEALRAMRPVMTALPPLVVAGPLAVAGLLLAFGRALPRRGPDIVALTVALAVCGLCLPMMWGSAQAPLVYWFGGWTPRDGHVLGIGFVVDQAGAGFAAFIGLLFAATLVFAWGYFDEVHAHFHVLMLLFMAGMVGFCITHDLFNMFVWFEVMSVAAFALTGYQLRSDALEGALNFTVVNTIGSYAILAGIGLIYSRTGALDFSAISVALSPAPTDPVISAAFTLIATGFLVKAAQVPFQFWLADAHAVAPSPVSVIFSGAMVALGIFGIARLTWAVFAPAPPVQGIVGTLLLGMGAGSAVLGGLMALAQRHIKRLLAFSTISHTGILLVGLALRQQTGLAGTLAYAVGHGLVKGALFMVAGILLATCGGIDEIGLRGRGRPVWPAGVAMGIGGLLLAGLPVGLLDQGSRLMAAAAQAAGSGWILVPVTLGAACTGGAVLRVTGRVFGNLGPIAGEEKHAPTTDEQEKADRPLWLMMLPTALLLVLSLPAAEAVGTLAQHAAAQMMQPDALAIIGERAPAPVNAEAPGLTLALPWLPWLSVTIAIVIAFLDLFRHHIPTILRRCVDGLSSVVMRPLQALHSGQIGDYVTWLAVGLALFSIAFVFA